MNLNDFLAILFAKAREAGLTEFDAMYFSDDNFRVTAFEGELDGYRVNTSQGLSFRALCGGNMGYAYTETLDEEAATMLVRMARENAALVESKDPQFIAEPAAHYPEVRHYNPALDEMTAQEKITAVLQLEQLAKADPRTQMVMESVLASGSSYVRLVNSKGVDCEYRDNLLYSYTEVAVADGERKVDGFEVACTQEKDGIDFAALARKAVDKAAARVGAHSIPSGQYPVILEHDAAGDLLGCFAGVFNAHRAQKGFSRLNGREGERIASPVITLVDDPLLEELSPEAAREAHGFAGMPFDGEGTAARAKAVIREGVLETLLHNLSTAAKAGTTSTGNASRGGYGSTVGVAPTNFYILPGQRSLVAMMADMGDGLVITEVSGLHAGANPTSGDFSLLAKGYRVQAGQRGEPVEQITVAGNFYELLEQITEVGSDLTFGLPGTSCVGTPSLLVGTMSIAGK